MESDHDSNNHEQEQWGESSSSRRRNSRFQAREGETLYEVVAIIAEKKRKYKVRWAGFNPDTSKPWDDSWIPKADVTDDLVENWEDLSEEERRAMNEHEEAVDKALKKPKPRKSSTRRGGKTVTKRRASTATTSATLSAKTRRGRRQFGESTSGQDAVAPKQEREPSVRCGKKRAYDDEDTDYSDPPEPDSISKSPARRTNKKLKTAHSVQSEEASWSPFEVSPPSVPAKKKSATARAIVETPREVSPLVSGDSEGEVAAVIRSPRAKKKGVQSAKTKRYRKPTVVPKSNRYNEFAPTESAEDEDQESSPEIESPKSRPKHSIASLESKEFVESEDEHYVQSAALPQSSSPRRDGEPRKRLEPSIKTLSRPKAKAQKKYIENETVGLPKRKSKTGITKAVVEIESVSRGKPPARTTSLNNSKAAPRTNRESVSRHINISPVLGSDVARRLDEFDADWEPFLKDQGSESASVRPASFAYGQSDVATDAVDIMYPPEGGDPGEEEEVPETQSQPRLEERPRPPLVTPSRVSLVSRMKPKTPRSTFTLEDPFDSQQNVIPPRTSSKAQKTLHPLPVLSPSKFTSHLPPSSFNGSTIENPDDSQPQPASSAEQIEEFESPEKRGRPRVIMAPLQSKTNLKRKGALDTLFTPAESTVEVRGKELAEQARSARLKEMGIAQPASRATLDDIRRARASSLAKSVSRSRSRASKSRSLAPISPPPPQNQADDEMDGLEYVEEGGANIPIITLDGPGEGVQVENEDTQMDDDERPHEVVDPVVRAIPEEEEESTQDLLHEMEVHRAMSMLGFPSPELVQQDAEDVSMVPQPGTVWAIPEEEEESTQDLLREMEAHRARGDLGSPSLEPAQEDVSMVPQPGSQQHPDRDQSPEIGVVPPLRAKSRDFLARHRPEEDSQEVPPTASANQSSSQATTSSLDSNGPKDIKAALSLLNMKSQEINHLERLLAEEKAKVGGLSIQVASLTKDYADLEIQSRDFEEKASRSDSELAKIASAYDTDRTRWAQEKADMEHALREATRQREGLVEVYALQQANAVKESELAFEAERAKWEDEKYHLELAIKGANDRKALAERDCASFRDEYMKSSATVGQLFGEKRELEKELGIAKKQASDGVAGIRALFGNQVALLTKALEHERKVSAGILGLDRRVNDEVRRKAAEEPEMRAKYHKHRDKVQELKGAIAVKDDELHNLEQDLAAAQRENEDLRARLEAASLVSPPVHRARSNRENGVARPKGNSNGLPFSQDPDAEVYRCLWRLEPGADSDRTFCGGLFSSPGELESHMLSAGHIPSSAGTLD